MSETKLDPLPRVARPEDHVQRRLRPALLQHYSRHPVTHLRRGDTLELLAGVPRQWLGDGQRIELDQVASYFGPLSLRVESEVDQDRMVAEIECGSDRHPATVEIRLPHPAGARAVWVEGGAYNARTERVRIDKFTGKARVELGFARRD